MKLKKIGFFDQVSAEEKKRLASQLPQTKEHGAKKKMTSYLRGGAELMMVAGFTRDFVDGKHPIIGAPHVLTDGTWAWSADVVYYLEKYNISLPDEFIDDMKQNEWIVPDVIDLASLDI